MRKEAIVAALLLGAAACTPEVREHDSPPSEPVAPAPGTGVGADTFGADVGMPAGIPGDTGTVTPRPKGDPRDGHGNLTDSVGTDAVP